MRKTMTCENCGKAIHEFDEYTTWADDVRTHVHCKSPSSLNVMGPASPNICVVIPPTDEELSRLRSQVGEQAMTIKRYQELNERQTLQVHDLEQLLALGRTLNAGLLEEHKSQKEHLQGELSSALAKLEVAQQLIENYHAERKNLKATLIDRAKIIYDLTGQLQDLSLSSRTTIKKIAEDIRQRLMSKPRKGGADCTYLEAGENTTCTACRDIHDFLDSAGKVQP